MAAGALLAACAIAGEAVELLVLVLLLARRTTGCAAANGVAAEVCPALTAATKVPPKSCSTNILGADGVHLVVLKLSGIAILADACWFHEVETVWLLALFDAT